MAPIEDFPPDKRDAIVAINLSAAFHTMRTAAPQMMARDWGRIIKTAALELATSGVTVNCIRPGYVWTPLVERQIPDTMKAQNLSREQVIHEAR